MSVKMEFEQLDILVKYVNNRINLDKFIEFMMHRYNDKSYIEGLWESFKKDPLTFISYRSEKELFVAIWKQIEITQYKG